MSRSTGVKQQRPSNSDANSGGQFLDALLHGLTKCSVASGRALIAVSGGADSVALLRGLCDLGPKLDLDCVVAHFHHGLRGREADADANWVESLANSLGLPSVIGRASADLGGSGIEAAARDARYAFLIETARERDCSRVLVAHTADDQVETILHHIVRGTGLAGLCGIPRRRTLAEGVDLIRPLLDISRADVEAYLRSIGQDWRADATNEDTALTRNRIRRELLPELRAAFNPQIDDALLRLGRQTEEHQAALEYVAAELIDRATVTRSATDCRIDCRILESAPRHLVRECLVHLWRDLDWPRQRMGFDDWDRLAEVVLTAGAVTLPDAIQATRQGHWLELTRRP